MGFIVSINSNGFYDVYHTSNGDDDTLYDVLCTSSFFCAHHKRCNYRVNGMSLYDDCTFVYLFFLHHVSSVHEPQQSQMRQSKKQIIFS